MLGGVFVAMTALEEHLQSIAMRLFLRLVLPKNTLAENGILFRTRSLVQRKLSFSSFLIDDYMIT
jgi:hypothetical protein